VYGIKRKFQVAPVGSRAFSGIVATPSRRGFAGGILAASVAALLPNIAEGSWDKPQNSAVELGPRPEDLSVADWDEVHARYSNLLRVYGERLSLDEKQRAARVLTTNQHMLASIRTFIVQNGDASACTLRIYDPER
jgi:hypothetical protein